MVGVGVAIEGPSAAGKSRTAVELAHRLGSRCVAEAYERLRPRPSLTWRSEAELLRLERRLEREEARRYREARRSSVLGRPVVLDTGFLGPLTYTAGLVALGQARHETLVTLAGAFGRDAHAGRWGLPEGIAYLRTPAGVRARRAGGDRRGHPPELQPRHQRVATVEARLYRDVIAPAFGARFRWVSGAGTPAEIVERIARFVNSGEVAGAGPRPAQLVRAIVRAVGVS